MSRYIDAEKLKRHYAWWKTGTAEMTLNEAKNVFDVIIDEQPTADVAEVVRCKECRHRPLMVDGDVKDPNYNESDLHEDYTCPYLCYEDEFYNCMPSDDGFCSCGEKMDEVAE